jgi:pSer/pThr/pTyr-binding forkhead associated (FHA) protein
MGEVNAGIADATAIWVEILARHHHEVATRYRFASTPITIGRAYDNDVVVDDPHVAAHHLRIARNDDGALIAEDLGSRNGLYVDRERERRAEIVLDGEHELRIGATVLRVRTAAYAVSAEQPIMRASSAYSVSPRLTSGSAKPASRRRFAISRHC